MYLPDLDWDVSHYNNQYIQLKRKKQGQIENLEGSYGQVRDRREEKIRILNQRTENRGTKLILSKLNGAFWGTYSFYKYQTMFL